MRQGTFARTRRCCYAAYLTQGIVNNLAPLLFTVFQAQYHFSFGALSTLILLNFGTQLLMDFFAVTCVERIGERRCTLAAHLCAAAGLFGMGVLPQVLDPFLGLCLAVVVSAMGSGLIEALLSPILDALPQKQNGRAASMALLHSFCCWGQVAVVLGTTLFLRIVGEKNWWWLPLLWACVPLCNFFAFCSAPLPEAVPAGQRTPVFTLLHTKIFCLCLCFMVCAGAADMTMGQWASLFVQRCLGIEKVRGDLLGPCLFAALQGAGRLLFGLFGKRFDLRHALLLCACACTACYLLAALSPVPAFALLGCALCGLSVSLLWPGLYSLSARAFPRGGTAMFGLLAVCGDIGCTAGPSISGMAAQVLPNGLSGGLLLGVAFPLGMACGLVRLLLFRRQPRLGQIKASKSKHP